MIMFKEMELKNGLNSQTVPVKKMRFLYLENKLMEMGLLLVTQQLLHAKRETE
jgi:hypothetical protein